MVIPLKSWQVSKVFDVVTLPSRQYFSHRSMSMSPMWSMSVMFKNLLVLAFNNLQKIHPPPFFNNNSNNNNYNNNNQASLLQKVIHLEKSSSKKMPFEVSHPAVQLWLGSMDLDAADVAWFW